MNILNTQNRQQPIFRLLFFLVIAFSLAPTAQAQNDEDIEKVREIYDNVLTSSSCYNWLHFLCKQIGGRIAGSPEGVAAERYTAQMLDSIGVDKVWMQEVEVNYWRRGSIAKAKVINSELLGNIDLSVTALGFSGNTPRMGLTAEVVKVWDLNALEKIPASEIKGKIVFFDKGMDPTKTNTFHAYGAAVGQRTAGPRSAAEKGAIATLTRSMTLKQDDVPHSGVTSFKSQDPIPALALGMQSANLLSELLDTEKGVKINIQADCEHMGKQKAHNVIAEIKGSTYPDEVIVVGGHLDSWDIGEGAHDDGTGCVQAMEVLHVFKRMGIRPKRTIRCVLFANEENGMFGATTYAEYAKNSKQKHIAAIESDAGGHTPRGFQMDAKKEISKSAFKQAQRWREILAPYGLYYLDAGGSAADISKLKPQGTVLFGYRPDSQRYFDYHHAETDVFENVHKRELELGAAGMAALVYLIDRYGFTFE